jgi:hypothetical protein
VDPWLGLVVALVVLLALALLVTAGAVTASRRREPVVEPLPVAEPEDKPLAVVVANPTKVEPGTREAMAALCAELGWAEPLWLETTVEDPGIGQAKEAVAAGADVVLAAGGDGTVRSVAESLAGTGVALGLLPAGTGNLLARTLGTPLDLEGARPRRAHRRRPGDRHRPRPGPRAGVRRLRARVPRHGRHRLRRRRHGQHP